MMLIAVSIYAGAVTIVLLRLYLHGRVQTFASAWSEGRESALSCLRSDSWWFSEDEPTMRVLSRLADGERVDSVRDKWRQERKG